MSLWIRSGNGRCGGAGSLRKVTKAVAAVMLAAFAIVADAPAAPPLKPGDPARATDPRYKTPLTLPGAETFVYHDVEPEVMRIHVFKPEGWKPSDRRPAFLFFFGGGWLRGTPSGTTGWMKDATRMGMVAVAPDYRVGERHGTDPGKSVADARAALRWLQERAEKFGIDPDRIVVSGSSAGGHVALWASLSRTPWGSDPSEAPLRRPAALVLMSAAIDTSEETGRFSERMKGHGNDLSPLQNLDRVMPPTLIIHGDKDNAVPYAQAVALDRRLRETGNVSRLVTMPGAGHGFQPASWRKKAPAMVEQFLREQKILR